MTEAIPGKRGYAGRKKAADTPTSRQGRMYQSPARRGYPRLLSGRIRR